MSEVQVKAWHCDKCGYEWLASGKAPLRCAKKDCRSWNWNKGEAAKVAQVEPVRVEEEKPLAVVASHSEACPCLLCQIRRKKKEA